MIRQALKDNTRELHSEVESKLRFLLSDDLSLDQYATAQKKLYGFYRPVESCLISLLGCDDLVVGLHKRLKLPLLIRDLSYLGIHSEKLGGLPLCKDIPCLQTIPAALGCLYVLEGSTLGGRIITSHLVKNVLPGDGRGCSFFNSYGDDVGPMWSSFLETLTRHCERHGDDDAVVYSARQTFIALNRWFSHDS